MIRAVIAENEVLARQRLRQLLLEIEEIEIVGESASAHETIELTRLTSPELLFLDVRMPDMDGFEIMDALSSALDDKRPHVIFVTANDRCAVRAFEIHAVDYLLKPLTTERLRSAVHRVRERQITVRMEPPAIILQDSPLNTL